MSQISKGDHMPESKHILPFLIFLAVFFITSDDIIKSNIFSEGCTRLPPTSGAIVYHPHTWSEGTEPHISSANSPEDTGLIWQAELCNGDKALYKALESSLVDKEIANQILGPVLQLFRLLKSPQIKSDFHLPFGQRRDYCSGCEGVIRLTRLIGCNNSGNPPLLADLGDPLFDLAFALGPDELWVTLEGAEFYVLPALHIGSCTYYLPFSVTIPGLYRLHAYALRSDYAALDEITYADRFPPLTLDSILGDKYLMQLGSTKVSEQDSARQSVLDSTSRLKALSSCSGFNGRVEGRYVRRVQTDKNTFAPETAPFAMPQLLGSRPMSFYVNLQEEFDFLPYSCRRSKFNAVQVASRCFSSRRFNFRGDSQMRVFYNHIMNRVCGDVHIAGKSGWYQSTCIFNSSLCQESQMCLTSDPMAESHADLNDFDILFINFGQHPASKYRISAANYRNMVESYFNNHNTIASPTLYWIETQTLCVRNDASIHLFGDWRTLHRVFILNQVARKILHKQSNERLSMNMIGISHAQLPMSQICPDGGHHIGVENVLDAMMWSLLDSFCPEWDG
jgi:hypothetical protein